MKIPVAILAAIMLSCSGHPRSCLTIDRQQQWQRLESQPAWVRDDFYTSLFYSGKQPVAEQVAWYAGPGSRFLACVAGSRHGCGDRYAAFTVDGLTVTKEENEGIVVCGGG